MSIRRSRESLEATWSAITVTAERIVMEQHNMIDYSLPSGFDKISTIERGLTVSFSTWLLV